MRSPIRMMIFGVLLMILGVVLPLLMVIQIIKSTFFLAFVSYGASLMGMIIAFIGLISYVRINRK